jgi:hypothetical protein
MWKKEHYVHILVLVKGPFTCKEKSGKVRIKISRRKIIKKKDEVNSSNRNLSVQ